jgi:hypothetical protein
VSLYAQHLLAWQLRPVCSLTCSSCKLEGSRSCQCCSCGALCNSSHKATPTSRLAWSTQMTCYHDVMLQVWVQAEAGDAWLNKVGSPAEAAAWVQQDPVLRLGHQLCRHLPEDMTGGWQQQQSLLLQVSSKCQLWAGRIACTLHVRACSNRNSSWCLLLHCNSLSCRAALLQTSGTCQY